MSGAMLWIAPGSWPGVSEPVGLRPSGLLLLPERGTGFVADLHLGKTTHFQRAGLAVPEGADDATLTRLDADLQALQAQHLPLRHLVVLGDLVHSRQALGPALQARLRALRERWPTLQLHLVWGNHDRHAQGALTELLDPLGWQSCPNSGWQDGPVRGLHEGHEGREHHAGQETPLLPDTRLTLLGHLHPAVRLRGAGRQQLRLACFAAGPLGLGTQVLLPAYGHFTGQSLEVPQACRWRYALAGDQVLALDGAPVQAAI